MIPETHNPRPQGQHQFATYCSLRNPQMKTHRHKGHARNAVSTHVYWDNRERNYFARGDLALYGWDETRQEYVLIRSWPFHEPVDMNEVRHLTGG